MNNFTMSEYIAANKLGVSPFDPTATRKIAAHLRAKGFRSKRVKRKGKFFKIWTSDPKPDLKRLQDKLERLS